MPQLTTVVPACDESAVLVTFHQRLQKVLDRSSLNCNVHYVDDGSRDDTWAIIESLITSAPCTSPLKLSRNFGKEAALTASLRLRPVGVD